MRRALRRCFAGTPVCVDCDAVGAGCGCSIGYCGGTTPYPTYRSISNYTETVQFEFDPSVVTYEQLMREFADGHDIAARSSTQYESVVFYHSDEQKAIAERTIAAAAAERRSECPRRRRCVALSSRFPRVVASLPVRVVRAPSPSSPPHVRVASAMPFCALVHTPLTLMRACPVSVWPCVLFVCLCVCVSVYMRVTLSVAVCVRACVHVCGVCLWCV